MSDRADVSKRGSWTMVVWARLMAPLVLIAAAGCADGDPTASDVDPVETVRSAVTNGFTKINAGGGASGSFVADDDFSGGTTTNTNHTITIPPDVVNPAPQAVYKDVRWATNPSTPFTYTWEGAGSLTFTKGK